MLRGITILNIYKLPNDNCPNPVLPAIAHPSLLASDFKIHYTSKNANYKNGEKLCEWLNTEDLKLIFNAKDRCTFHFDRCNHGYYPDLCVITKDKTGVALEAHRTVLSYFPKSQNRPIPIKIEIQIPLVKTIPKSRWKFRNQIGSPLLNL